jgi:predicted nucleic acid-binding protein
MISAVDTSVVVAAFAPWHEAHSAALPAVRQSWLPAHVGLEAFSTLTRLPEPFRAPASVVAEYLQRRFEGRWLFPDPGDVAELPHTLAELGIQGGTTYDALVAVTVRHHQAMLRSLDTRAERVYRLLGVDFEQVR